jgi:CO dehydrogenase/acetyl-CoA synthase beta subunit
MLNINIAMLIRKQLNLFETIQVTVYTEKKTVPSSTPLDLPKKIFTIKIPEQTNRLNKNYIENSQFYTNACFHKKNVSFH